MISTEALKVVENMVTITLPFEKTKDFAKILKNIQVKVKTLAVLDGSDASISRVSRNIPNISLKRASDVNAYDVLRNAKILVTKSALKKLLERIS